MNKTTAIAIEETARMVNARYTLVIFDADGTLRHVPEKPGKPPTLRVDKWKLLPNVLELVYALNCDMAIASNQACVGRGELTFNDAYRMLISLGETLGIDSGRVKSQLPPSYTCLIRSNSHVAI